MCGFNFGNINCFMDFIKSCFGGNCWWIIILLLLFCCCGNNGGCANAANNNCGCGGCGC